MIAAGDYSYSDKAPHGFDNVLLMILAGIVVTMVIYAIISRKLFSVGIPFMLSAVVVLQDYLIKKLNVRLYLDLVVLMIGLCVGWFARKIQKNTDSQNVRR